MELTVLSNAASTVATARSFSAFPYRFAVLAGDWSEDRRNPRVGRTESAKSERWRAHAVILGRRTTTKRSRSRSRPVQVFSPWWVIVHHPKAPRPSEPEFKSASR